MYTAELTAGKHVSPGLANRPFNQKLLSAFWQIAAKNLCTHTPTQSTKKKTFAVFKPAIWDWRKSIYLWSDATCNWNECALWFVYLSVKACLLLKQNVSRFSLEADRTLWVVFCLWTASLPAAAHTMQCLIRIHGEKYSYSQILFFNHSV